MNSLERHRAAALAASGDPQAPAATSGSSWFWPGLILVGGVWLAVEYSRGKLSPDKIRAARSG